MDTPSRTGVDIVSRLLLLLIGVGLGMLQSPGGAVLGGGAIDIDEINHKLSVLSVMRLRLILDGLNWRKLRFIEYEVEDRRCRGESS